jgi:hypothetical protein
VVFPSSCDACHIGSESRIHESAGSGAADGLAFWEVTGRSLLK